MVVDPLRGYTKWHQEPSCRQPTQNMAASWQGLDPCIMEYHTASKASLCHYNQWQSQNLWAWFCYYSWLEYYPTSNLYAQYPFHAYTRYHLQSTWIWGLLHVLTTFDQASSFWSNGIGFCRYIAPSQDEHVSSSQLLRIDSWCFHASKWPKYRSHGAKLKRLPSSSDFSYHKFWALLCDQCFYVGISWRQRMPLVRFWDQFESRLLQTFNFSPDWQVAKSRFFLILQWGNALYHP